MPVSRYRLVLAACLAVLCTANARAQSSSPVRGKYDSITVTKLTFEGAKNVSPDDLKRGLYTRPSTCRLPFLIPVCKVTGSQLFTDRRRTTSAAMAGDLDKLRIYYWLRGYRHAEIDTVVIPGSRGSAVVFRIAEGEPTRVGTLTITQRDSVLSAKEVGDIVELTEGGPLSLIALDSTIAHLHSAVWNKGYGDVRIDTTLPAPDASRIVPVRIDIDPRWITRVGSVEFEGNRYLSDAALRRGVLLQPGTLYTRDAVLESQRRLFQNPALARALVITPVAGDSVKRITVAVTETAPVQLSATLGFNTIDYGQAAVEARHHNLGSGRWVSLRANVGNLMASQLDGSGVFRRSLPEGVPDQQGFLDPTYQATVTLTQPWIAGARTSAAVTAFAGRRSLTNVVIDENFGGTLGLVRELAPRTPIGINYRIESTRVQGSAVYFCTGYGICDAATRTALTSRQRLAPLGVSAWVDRADDLENPRLGYTGVVDAEHASGVTGSTFAHTRVATDASYYRSFGERRVVAGVEQFRKVLALHGRAGYVRPHAGGREALGIGGTGPGILHPRARFYAGGMQSVRGFAENELGPTVLQARRPSLLAAGCTDATIASGQCDPSAIPSNELFPRPVGGSSVMEGTVELRVPLAKALGTVVFLDGAYVGTGGLSSLAKARGAVTPGAGFRYRSPLGVLRLDFGLRPVGTQQLPVVAAVTNAAGADDIVVLAREKSWSPLDPSPGALRKIARRLVVHFAMGQAF